MTTTTTRPAVLAAATPSQGALLAVLNAPASVSTADLAEALQLLQYWYPFAASVWLEHNA